MTFCEKPAWPSFVSFKPFFSLSPTLIFQIDSKRAITSALSPNRGGDAAKLSRYQAQWYLDATSEIRYASSVGGEWDDSPNDAQFWAYRPEA
ncbi:hypothetical protein C0995_012606 [Termitomyces sp. Mi166|nr:hypothetical protein C0995_012606 [Termitomyces sp. Mi166\